MANLNFQMTPRNPMGASTIRAQVAPTFALSPGRGCISIGAGQASTSRATFYGHRPFLDRRLSNVARFPGGYNSVFGEAGDTALAPGLDLSEFPSLTAYGEGDQTSSTAQPPPGTKPYVGMVKQPVSEQPEFTMSSEDFPALPGTSGIAPPLPFALPPPPEETTKKGIQIAADGTITNIPESMIPNQYGIVGLLTFIRAAESDPNLVSLALGQDLTALGLNLNSSENLYLTFGGPFADTTCRPQDQDFSVPPEYLIGNSVKDKLPPIRLNQYKEDLLFYMFYNCVGDAMQIAVAAELYDRDWRYHMEEKVWISQAPGMAIIEKTATYERGTYFFFDTQNWRKVAKEFYLEYCKLEGRPQLPVNMM